MHRKPLLNLISIYRQNHPTEKHVIEQFISFVEAYSDCFDRQLEIGHITGSAWVVNQEGTEVLLTHHRKLNKWLQLGGHADGEADLLSVALRETLEESGLETVTPISRNIFDLDIHLIPKRGREKAHYHYDIRFSLQNAGSERFEVSEESHALSWVPIDDLDRIAPDASIRRMQRKWLDRDRDPSITEID